jgi:hypothetical protein
MHPLTWRLRSTRASLDLRHRIQPKLHLPTKYNPIHDSCHSVISHEGPSGLCQLRQCLGAAFALVKVRLTAPWNHIWSPRSNEDVTALGHHLTPPPPRLTPNIFQHWNSIVPVVKIYCHYVRNSNQRCVQIRSSPIWKKWDTPASSRSGTGSVEVKKETIFLSAPLS